jgi:hypothetical protein
MRDFFLPPWVNSLYTQPADSFGNLTCGTNRSGLSAHTANSNKPPAPPPIPVLANLAIQPDKTAAELLCLRDIFIYIFISSFVWVLINEDLPAGPQLVFTLNNRFFCHQACYSLLPAKPGGQADRVVSLWKYGNSHLKIKLAHHRLFSFVFVASIF